MAEEIPRSGFGDGCTEALKQVVRLVDELTPVKFLRLEPVLLGVRAISTPCWLASNGRYVVRSLGLERWFFLDTRDMLPMFRRESCQHAHMAPNLTLWCRGSLSSAMNSQQSGFYREQDRFVRG